MNPIDENLIYRMVSNDKGRLVGVCVANGDQIRLSVTEKIWTLLLGKRYFYRIENLVGAAESTLSGYFCPVGDPLELAR